MTGKTRQMVSASMDNFEKQFAYVDLIINKHQTNAVATVNVESLLTAWEVGRFISIQLKSAQWGAKVVSDLADYLKRQNPKRRGFGKRNLYNMVKFYDIYSNNRFIELTRNLGLGEFVQLPIAQIESDEIVQLSTAQFEEQTWTRRSLSPTIVAEYRSKLIPQEVMQRSLEEYCAFLGNAAKGNNRE